MHNEGALRRFQGYACELLVYLPITYSMFATTQHQFLLLHRSLSRGPEVPQRFPPHLKRLMVQLPLYERDRDTLKASNTQATRATTFFDCLGDSLKVITSLHFFAL